MASCSTPVPFHCPICAEPFRTEAAREVHFALCLKTPSDVRAVIKGKGQAEAMAQRCGHGRAVHYCVKCAIEDGAALKAEIREPDDVEKPLASRSSWCGICGLGPATEEQLREHGMTCVVVRQRRIVYLCDATDEQLRAECLRRNMGTMGNLGEAVGRLTAAERERDEWKARAQDAEHKLTRGDQPYQDVVADRDQAIKLRNAAEARADMAEAKRDEWKTVSAGADLIAKVHRATSNRLAALVAKHAPKFDGEGQMWAWLEAALKIANEARNPYALKSLAVPNRALTPEERAELEHECGEVMKGIAAWTKPVSDEQMADRERAWKRTRMEREERGPGIARLPEPRPEPLAFLDTDLLCEDE